ncbi:MAG TPA: tetratricopeptide repeat protein, partial [Pyrinomonadaceae bacterium]|nr:tetratricopeptide repeat protein [Pyrinomonadaceae bacterium]
MTKSLIHASRALFVALCLLAFGAGVASRAQQQPSGQKTNPPKKKKLPAGARGFEPFADRDASDKLVTGGATRGKCGPSYEEFIDCGSGHYENKEYREAVDAFQKASAAKPDMFKAQYLLGIAYEAAGNYKDAAAAYKRAVALKLDEGESENAVLSAYYNLGNVYAAANQQAEAIAAYQQVISRLPVPVHTPHYNIGLAYAALGKQPEAVKEFQEAIKIKPDYWEAHYNLGLAYSKSEQYPE